MTGSVALNQGGGQSGVDLRLWVERLSATRRWRLVGLVPNSASWVPIPNVNPTALPTATPVHIR